MIFKPTEQSKNKTEFTAYKAKPSLLGLQQEWFAYMNLGSEFFEACLKTYTSSLHAEK